MATKRPRLSASSQGDRDRAGGVQPRRGTCGELLYVVICARPWRSRNRGSAARRLGARLYSDVKKYDGPRGLKEHAMGETWAGIVSHVPTIMRRRKFGWRSRGEEITLVQDSAAPSEVLDPRGGHLC